MQLTLVNTKFVQWTFDGRDSLSFENVKVRPALSTDVASHNVHVHPNLMSELLTGENCFLKVDLRYMAWQKPILEVKCTTPANNILERLRKRFGHGVKLSLTVKWFRKCSPYFPVDHNINPSLFLCVEDMTFDDFFNNCVAYCDRSQIEELKIIAVRSNVFSMQMIITASIQDKINPITKQHNIQPNKKITIPQKILENGLVNDIVIIAENGAEIKAHKSFLYAWSAAFEREFESGMVESQTGRHDMSDMSEPGIMAFLRYMYYEDLEGPNQNAEIAYEMLYAAHKYEVTELEEVMLKLLLNKADTDFNALSALKIYCFVRNVDSFAQLKSKMIRILKMKIDEVHAIPEYKEMFQKNPDDAMELCHQLAKATLK